MKKHTFKKRMVSAILSGAMLLSGAAMPANALTTRGAPMIYSDFDDGVGLPWHTCVTQPAALQYDIEDGVYKIKIINNGGKANGGADRWDCQFRHRKLKFHAGYTYHLHAEVTADHDGEIFTYIDDLSGGSPIWINTMGATEEAVGYEGTPSVETSWTPIPVKAGETLVIDAEFTPTEDLDVAEWTFMFGGAGEYQKVDCFPVGTTLTFDNMLLENLTDGYGSDICIGERRFYYDFAVDQNGYLPDAVKTAVLHTDEVLKNGGNFYLLNASDDSAVYTGKLAAQKMDQSSGQYCAVADFSDFKTPGTYYMSLDGKSRDSYDFKITEDAYEGIMTNAVNYFYQNRSGMPIEEKYITSTGANDYKGPLAHNQCRDAEDTGSVQQEWIRISHRYSNDDAASDLKHTAKGGWYEAENHTKSVINGANAVWMLQNLYERALSAGTADRFLEASPEIVTPEHGNKIPDILDETKYELDFLMSMMVPEDSGYELRSTTGYDANGEPFEDTKKYAGMLYHQIQDNKWTGIAIHEWDYIYSKDWEGITRIVQPPTTTATLAGAAVFAQASRLFKPYDPEYAKKLLECAVTAYEAAKANPSLFPMYDASISSRSTGDDQITDDLYWAACELYITTGEKAYLKDLEASDGYAYQLKTALTGGENTNTASSFNWGNTGGYGSLSLLLHSDLLSKDNKTKLEKSLTDAADQYLKMETKDAFRVPYVGVDVPGTIGMPGAEENTYSGYENDSNGIILNNAIVLAYANDVTGDKKYYNGITAAMDYIFGENPNDISYVTGYGTYHVSSPYHRYWAHDVDDSFPYAPSGVLSSGPNSRLDDDIVKGFGLKRGKVAPQRCYREYLEAWSVNSCSLTLNASLAWMSGYLSTGSKPVPKTPYITGDINGDGSIGISDAVQLSKYLIGELELTEEHYYAADMNGDGLVNATDLTLLKRSLIAMKIQTEE